MPCDTKEKLNCIITGGGSGGHIYPALAVADEIMKLNNDCKIILVGSRRGLEKKIFSKTKYQSHYLPVGQLHSSVGKITQLISFIKLPFCFVMSFYLILRYRPKFVFGVGGYASGPLGILSSLLGVPTYIWEGNATPGLTNRLLGKFNTKPFLVFAEAAKFFKKNKPVLTGVPMRESLEQGLSKNLSVGRKRKEFTVLFVGGSQGARIFNQIVPKLFNEKAESLKDIYVIHQTGLKNHDEVLKAHLEDHDNLETLAYLDPIRDYYNQADLVVCRAGSSTVNELSLLGKPSVLVPFPKASDDHQRKNAQSLVSKGAAIMIEEKDFSSETLLKQILSLRDNPGSLEKIKKASQSAFPLGAREVIAKVLLGQSNL